MRARGSSKGGVLRNRDDGELRPATRKLLNDLIDLVQSRLAESRDSDSPLRSLRHSAREREVTTLGAGMIDALRAGDLPSAAHGCLQLGEWAEEKQALFLAARYYALAAELDPLNGRACYRAGRVARRQAAYEDAERWFQEAISRGSNASDWETLALSHAGLGNMQDQAGSWEIAEISHLRSLAVALDHRLPHLAGDAFHNLAVIAFAHGRTDEGVSYARQALDACFTRRDRVARLAHDLAYAWMTSQRAPDRALPVFREVLNVFTEPAHRLVVLGNVAHALGMLGDQREFDVTVAEIETLLKPLQNRERVASALLDVAHGAAALGRFTQARRFAERSKEAAVLRKEARMDAEVGEFLRAVARREPPRSPIDAFHGHVQGRRVNDLAGELIEALR